MMETISIRIDGQDIMAQKGSTILEVALANKIHVPYLCYHPDLKPAGSCRVCLVELESGQLVASCRTPIKEGMIIKTKSTEVDRIRRTVVEMIIANHHMDCKNCLKKGQCELQKIMAYMKIDKKNIKENLRAPEVEMPLDESNPFFIRDQNKCILCGICVRTCQNISRINAIDFTGRGNNTKIATFGDKPIAESTCTSCGECVIRCPVGALTVRRPKRPAREVKTICPYCSVGCSIFLGTRENAIVNVQGDAESPINKGHLCVKGRFGLSFVHSPDRLKEPLKRGKTDKAGDKDTPPDSPPYQRGSGTPYSSRFRSASWDEVLETIAKKLKKFKGEEVAIIASTKCTNEENYVVQKFARVVLSTNNIDSSARLCDAPSIAALAETNGITLLKSLFSNGVQEGGDTDVEKAASILIVGANITRSHPMMGQKIKKAVENGSRLIIISPKEHDLCQLADIWMKPYPGTDLALIMGMCNVIIEENLHDNVFIEEHAKNFDAFKESAEDFSLGRVERITGVPRHLVKQAVEIFANNKPSAILWGTGVTQYSQGTNNVLSLINLSILTGNIRYTLGLLPLWRQNNGLGACTVGCLPDYYPGFQPVADPEIRKRFEAEWGKTLNPEPGLTLTEILDAVREGKIKALYIIGTNLLISSGHTKKAKEGLKKAKFVVYQDMFMNETAEFADIILPAATFVEKDGTFINAERLIQKIQKALEPIGKAKPDWQILCELAKRLKSSGFDFNNTEEIISEISSVTSGNTPIDKFKFIPLQYKSPAEVTDIDYPLILTTESDLYSGRFLSKKVEGFEVLKTKDIVYINPKDATDFEISDGQELKVISRWGNIHGIANLTGSMPTGLISMNLSEEKMNQLINPVLDEVSKTPELKICAVKIESLKGSRNE